MTLKWRQDGALHFAHTDYGMYMIEQSRGRFLMTLTLKGIPGEQDLEAASSLARAKKEVEKMHKIFVAQER